MSAQSDPSISWGTLGLTGSGVFLLAWLIAGKWMRRHDVAPSPEPFQKVDSIKLAGAALGIYVAYAFGMAMMRLGPVGAAGGIALCLLVALLLFRTVFPNVMRPRGTRRRRLGRGLLLFWASLPVVYGVMVAMEALLGPGQQESVRLLRERAPGWQALAVAAVVVAPLMEEMIFRGLLYPALRRIQGRRVALAVTSVAFGAIHMEPVAIVPLALLGFVLGYLVETTGSLLAPCAAHAAFNALTVGQIVFLG